MPRPGPRPYECVRRAWHSDRHQPIRGSLIQELFRVANELHSPSTRKNKEWQEKLPFVVLKAEEIMYSKANSEAEYMDLKTLLDRANDAIDTIIRRDDSNESGDLLEPCIEAALNLGCVPRRASRSQRHSSPRCYLTPSSQQPGGVDPPTTSLGAPDGNIRAYQHQGPYPRMPLPVSSPGRPQACNYQFIPRYPSLGSPVPANCGSMRAGSAAPMLASERRDSLPISYNGFSLPYMQSTHADQDKGMTFPPEACPWSGLGHVYPLYYPLSCQNAQLPVQDLGSSNCNAVASSNSSVPHTRETEAGCLYNFLPVNNVEEAQNEPSNIGNMSENRPEFDFDLSLRLGCPSEPYSGGGCSWVREVDDVGSSSSYRGNKYRDVGDSPISL